MPSRVAISFVSKMCKDELPDVTVDRIKGIVQNLGLEPTVSFGNPMENLWWVNLAIPQTNVFANGKGMTRELALASAYGELMERLQNQSFFFTVDMDFDEGVYTKFGFLFAPDEEYSPVATAIEDVPPEIWRYLSPTGERASDIQCLVGLSEETPPYIRDKGDFVVIPFYEVFGRQIVLLPLPLVKYLYGTNGMCAGNTPAEAMVQGICEIMERYINRKALSGRLRLHNIPRVKLERYEPEYAIVRSIESAGPYKVLIKDCSIETGLPVVCAIVLDMDRKGYFIKFGSHPVFEIALSRCLTELLQGRTMDALPFSMCQCIPYWKRSDLLAEENIRSIIATGKGIYPLSILSDSPTHSSWNWGRFCTNEAMLEYLMQILRRSGLKILIRNVSFLGFPSFHIVIPGMSEVLSWGPRDWERIGRKARLRELVRKMPLWESNEIKELAQLIENDRTVTVLGECTGFPTGSGFPLRLVQRDLFLACAFYRLGQLKKAYEYIERYLIYLQAGNRPHSSIEMLQYYSCVRDYFAILLEKDALHGTELLEMIHGQTTTRQVETDLADPRKAFRDYPRLMCWKCEQCTINKQECYYPQTRHLFETLKVIQQKNPVNQIDIDTVLRGVLR